ncbi:MAG: hypothetical protein CMG69_01520 [Candidatus Marinimicrobia bacterium]|nr:hypothetical protein [Candidatus Neomarinimicrobiota bacterium]|tara:strand:+ start:80229 stop:81740 length:1512 start_codon:yes stop_codon:yes gene_type:complete
MYIITSQQSRELDKISGNEFGISGETLMGNAGEKIADTVLQNYQNLDKKNILIVCGKGNNGGDGFAAAAALAEFSPQIYHIYSPKKFKNDTLHYYEECIEKGISILFQEDPSELKKFDLIIDAMLGVGISGKVREPVAGWIDWLNRQSAEIVAVDIPSGINADTGFFSGTAVRANMTISMGFEKTGHHFFPGKDSSEEVIVADIGFPKIDNPLSGIQWRLFDRELPEKILIAPPKDSYKHGQGKVLVIAGSRGMTGASILAGKASLRSGAGLVKLCAPNSLSPIVESLFIEGITLPCEDNGKGYFRERNFEEIEKELYWCDSLVIGPGLGSEADTKYFILKVIESCKKPMIIDADALRFINGHISLLPDNCVLTPHLAEFSYMVNHPVYYVRENFIRVIEEFMNDFSGTLVIKTTPVSVVFNDIGSINISGNQGLASAGTGDVLAGCIGGLIAQNIAPPDASKLGVYIHGKAADTLVSETGYRGLTATDVLNNIHKVIKEYEL